MFNKNNAKIAVIGLGYVGLPLAIEFSKKFDVVGFDINHKRVLDLNAGNDFTLEVSRKVLKNIKNITFSSDIDSISKSNIYIVTVPTPIDINKNPDLGPLYKATQIVAKSLKSGDIVIYESTVYPGATEDECIPILEKKSGLVYNKDFFAGYSPERINPGDKEHTLPNILKIVSGSNKEVASYINEIYGTIIKAGTYVASSIKVAEAAKVIENTQRDVNIALINELSIIFSKLNIDTYEVLEAAGTKWNFLPFRPGLVGGHCIGVDPYYLTYKAQSIGYSPEMILSGRKINDGMSEFVVSQLIKKLIKENIQIEGSNVLIMGLTFKENCPDLRNTKVIDVLRELKLYKINVDIIDPWCSHEEASKEYGIDLIKEPRKDFYDAVILCVAHNQFKVLNKDELKSYGKNNCIFYDLKYVLPSEIVDIRL